MEKTKVTSKGQVTIPKDVRDSLGLRPGDEIEFVEDELGFHIRKLYDPSGLDAYTGYLKHLAGRDPDDVVEELRGR
jgi:AbrB family looped-hinge helix DNA binding protein